MILALRTRQISLSLILLCAMAATAAAATAENVPSGAAGVAANLTPAQEKERDKAFAEVVQKLHQGLLELAKEYPQLAISRGHPIEIYFGHELEHNGELHFGVGRSNRTWGKRPQEEDIPDNLTLDFGVALVPIGSPNQAKIMPLFPHLGLAGIESAKAGEAKLDAALKKLLEDSLAPLKELDARVAAAPTADNVPSGAFAPPAGEWTLDEILHAGSVKDWSESGQRLMALKSVVQWHRQIPAEEDVRMTWFLGGHANVAMKCETNKDYTVDTVRSVYNLAEQCMEARKLSHIQLVAIQQIAAHMPATIEAVELRNLILVTVHEGGKAKTFLYDRLKAPPEILRLYDLTGAYLSTYPVKPEDGPGKEATWLISRGPALTPANVPSGAKAPTAVDKESWGAPVEGVQVRGWSKETVWGSEEIPVLHVDFRNVGHQEYLEIIKGQCNLQLEVDGKWYVWPPFMSGGQMLPLGVGTTINDQILTLSAMWQMAEVEDLEWRGDGPIVIKKDAPARLELAPGKHTIRVAAIIMPARAKVEGFRVVSAPGNLEIKAESDARRAFWPVSGPMTQAVVDLWGAWVVTIQELGHGNYGDKTVEALTRLSVQADQLQNLSRKSPLEPGAGQAAKALRQLLEQIHSGQGDKEASALEVSAALQGLIMVASGESESKPSEPTTPANVPSGAKPPATRN